jgi:plasmid stabilization system protein ParE
MALKVKLHRRARSNLAAIKAYPVREAGARSAERVRSHLNTRILRLGRNPNLGISSDEPSIRILSPTKYP